MTKDDDALALVLRLAHQSRELRFRMRERCLFHRTNMTRTVGGGNQPARRSGLTWRKFPLRGPGARAG